MSGRVWSRLLAGLVWAAVAASAVYWGLRIASPGQPVPPQARLADGSGAARGDWARLLGADAPVAVAAVPAGPPPDARFQLIGVVSPRAPRAASEGLALIAVDGKAAKAYRVGAVVEGQNILQSVSARGATLGPRGGGAAVALAIAPPAAATTGTLPGAFPGAGMPTNPFPNPSVGTPMQSSMQPAPPPPLPPGPNQPRRVGQVPYAASPTVGIGAQPTPQADQATDEANPAGTPDMTRTR